MRVLRSHIVSVKIRRVRRAASFMIEMYQSSVHVNGNGNGFFLDTFPLVTRSLVESGYDCGVIPNLRLASAHRRIDTCANGEYRYCQSSHTRRDDWTHGHDYANWLRQKGYILRQFTRDAEGMPPEVHETTWCVEKTIWNSRRNWTLSICSQSFQSKSRYSQSWMFEVLYWSYIVTAGGGLIRHLPDAGLANEAWLVEMLVLTGHQDSWDIHSATEHKRA